MKKAIVFLSLILVISCKNDKKTEEIIDADSSEKTAKQSDGLTLLKGDFIFYDNAAILQTQREIYGVIINNKAEELNKKVASYKNEKTDMVPVEIRGRISDKEDEKIQWKHKVEIIEILNVFEPKKDTNNTIKIGKE